MRKFFCSLFLLTLIFNLSFSSVEINLLPSANFYGDQTGIDAALGVSADMKTLFNFNGLNKLYMGLFFSLSYASINDLSIFQTGGGVNVRYDLFFLNAVPLSLSPGAALGVNYSRRADSLGIIDEKPDFLVTPGLSLDYRLTPNLKIGLGAGLKFIINDGYYACTLLGTLGLSYVFNSGPAKTAGSLNSDIENVIKNENIKADVVSSDENGIRLNFSEILFELNSFVLNPKYAESVKDMALALKNYPQFYVIVEGHTDDIGDDSVNTSLSEKRAKVVADLFVQTGVPFSKVFSKGYGKSQPLVPNTSDENRKKNRRVEIRFIRNN